MASEAMTSDVGACCPAGEAARERVEDAKRQVRRTFMDIRHGAEDRVADAALRVRRHPLASVSLAAAAGAFVGLALGCAAGWMMRTRRG